MHGIMVRYAADGGAKCTVPYLGSEPLFFFLALAKLDGANAAGASTRYTRFTD